MVSACRRVHTQFSWTLRCQRSEPLPPNPDRNCGPSKNRRAPTATGGLIDSHRKPILRSVIALDHRLADLTIVLVTGLSAGTIVSALAWPLFDRGGPLPASDRSQSRVLVGVIVMAAGLIALSAAPRVHQLNTIAAATWQNAGFGYLFAIFWIVPILHGRAVASDFTITIGRKWRHSLMYVGLAASVAVLFVVVVQGATWANVVALSLAASGIAAARNTSC